MNTNSRQLLSLSPRAKNLLKAIEELRLEPYDDQTGENILAWVEGATIGYGHLISIDDWDKFKDGITVDQADQLFSNDLIPFVNAVNRRVEIELSQNQFDALVLFAFNIGVGGFERSSALKLINDPSAITIYPNLEAAWKAWNKSQGKVMQGLISRRNAEWNIYYNNIYRRW